MLVKTVHSDDAPAAIGPYSQARISCNLIFCSGQIALTASGEDFTQDTVEVQTRVAMQNLAAVLKAANSGFSKAIKITIYLVDMADFQAVNKVYGEFFTGDPPARATVAVAGLPKGARVEIDCIAAVDNENC